MARLKIFISDAPFFEDVEINSLGAEPRGMKPSIRIKRLFFEEKPAGMADRRFFCFAERIGPVTNGRLSDDTSHYLQFFRCEDGDI
jgi:hypothetical protein